MRNALTGDFDAVLELSGDTINRLLASAHQNALAATGKPNLPHVAYFRLGNDTQVPGAAGSVAVQIGVPRVELIHGATDRFRLHTDLRIRYHADPGSTPLADIIHGTVHADYLIDDIDPSCLGWRGIAGDYLWMRVIKETVRFDGVLRNQARMLSVVGLLDEQAAKGRVEKLLATLLETTFAPAPQLIGQAFRRLRSLALGTGRAQSGVAVPVGLAGQAPVGDLASIGELFLDGRDFGLAVGREHILAAVTPALGPLAGLQRDVHVHGDAGVGGGLEIDYHVRLDAVTVEWVGPFGLPLVTLSGGLIRVRASGQGWASRLYRSGVFNVGAVHASDLRMGFGVEQLVLLGFDAGAERLTVTALGTPAVSLDYHGPYSGEVAPVARDAIAGQTASHLEGALAQARNALVYWSAPGRKAALIDQLGRIDGAAAARFTDADFRADGLVLRGTIALTHRYPPVVSFVKTAAGDGFDAIACWIPGGRVDAFEWTWRWFTNGVEAAPGPPGEGMLEDAFLLRRQQGPRNNFGVALNRELPLPGLDGNGRVCLVIRGVRVDQVTGALVPVTSIRACTQYGYEIRMPYEVSAYARLCDPLLAMGAEPAPAIGVMRIGAADVRDAASNTLVLYLGERWDEAAATALRAGLARCRREDAGLLVVVLFRHGVLGRGGRALQGRLRKLGDGLPAPMMANEDIREAWTRLLAFPVQSDEPSWRLMAPDGTLRWSHDGTADAGLVAAVLEERLVPSAPAGTGRIGTDLAPGDRVPVALVTRHCPPVPLGRAGFGGSTLVFVHKDSTGALAQLAGRHTGTTEAVEPAPYIAIVLEGANADEADALRAHWKLDMPVFADQDGALTRAAGVRFSPSTLILDERGRLARYTPGIDAGPDHAAAPCNNTGSGAAP